MLKSEFYLNFENASKEEVDNVIKSLGHVDSDLITYIWGVNSKKRSISSKQALNVIEKVKKKLYKKNLFKVFSKYDKAKVFDLVYDLDDNMLELLLKEYSFKSDSVREKVNTFEKSKNYYTISKIGKALLDNKSSFKKEYTFDAKNYKGLFNQINEDKELILKGISLLSPEERRLLKLKYGENYDEVNLVDSTLNDEINIKILRKIKRRINDLKNSKSVKITDLIDEDIDVIRYKVGFLRKNTRELIYSKFGDDLSKEVILMGNEIVLKMSTINAIKNVVINESSLGKTLFNALSKYKLNGESDLEFSERVKDVIDKYLREEDIYLLKKKYGVNLDETVHGKDLTKDERYFIDHILIYRIRNYLKVSNKSKVYYKGLDGIFTKEELELVKVYISKMSEEEQTLLKIKYGEDFMSPREKGTLSNKDLEVIKKILQRFERNIVKDSNIFKVSDKSLLYMRRLAKTSEYDRIKDIYGKKEALGIMALVYGKSITFHDIELVTGLTLDKIEVLASCYLDNVDRKVYSKLLRTRKH